MACFVVFRQIYSLKSAIKMALHKMQASVSGYPKEYETIVHMPLRLVFWKSVAKCQILLSILWHYAPCCICCGWLLHPNCDAMLVVRETPFMIWSYILSSSQKEFQRPQDLVKFQTQKKARIVSYFFYLLRFSLEVRVRWCPW